MNEVYLKYVGAGSWRPGIPARDLTKAEAEYFGLGTLLDSNLYVKVSGQQYPDLSEIRKQLGIPTVETVEKKRGTKQ